MNAASEPQPPRFVLDDILQRAPLHLFVLDRDLVCRYAAPVGDSFLGLPRADLVGLDIGDILPPARNGLRQSLHDAAHERKPWAHPQHEYRHPTEDGEVLYVWAVSVEPVALRDSQGVLLTLRDILEHVQTRTRLEFETERLRTALRMRDQQAAARAQAAHELCLKVRNLLAPITGYLQVIARRPTLLTGQTLPEVIERNLLPQLGDLVDRVDRFESALQESAPKKASGA